MPNTVEVQQPVDAAVTRTVVASILERTIEVVPVSPPEGGEFLVVAGISLDVQVGGASESTGDYLGHEERAFAGNLLSTRRTHKREWKFTCGPMPRATYFQLRALVVAGFVDCHGAALDEDDSAVIRCAVRVEEGGYMQDGTYHQRLASLTIREQ